MPTPDAIPGDSYAGVELAAATLQRLLGDVPAIAVVLGSGLGPFADRPRHPVVVPYGDVPGWPVPTVAGHENMRHENAFRDLSDR